MATLAAASLCGASAALAGPVSALYLTSGDQNELEIVQGSSVTHFAATSTLQYPIAVLGTVRTAGAASSYNGAEYTLAGVPTGITYPAGIPGVANAYDGTTNGINNFTVDYSGGGVYKTGLDWTSPVLLFAITAPNNLSITYQAANNSLWISSWGTNTITDYSMSGAILSSFTVPVVEVAGLALDPADGTLWFGTQSDFSSARTLYQYSTAGTFLSSAVYAGLTGDNFLGGEFGFVSLASVPEPVTLAIFGAGLAGAAALRRRRAKKA